MRPVFWLSIALAMLAVSCTTSNNEEIAHHELAYRAPARSDAAAGPAIRCAAAELPPQSDPCSAKTMAGQRLRR